MDIEKFASRPGVRRIAVENFLDSMPLEIGMMANQLNCAKDSVLYGWNGPTITAIFDGIYEAYGGNMPEEDLTKTWGPDIIYIGLGMKKSTAGPGNTAARQRAPSGPPESQAHAPGQASPTDLTWSKILPGPLWILPSPHDPDGAGVVAATSASLDI